MMHWLLILLLILGVLLLTIFVWGYLHLRSSVRTANEAADKVDLALVPELAEECAKVFREKFNKPLSLHDFDSSAMVFSNQLDDFESIKRAFAKEGFYWYGVLPCGAFLGELIRIKTDGRWNRDDANLPVLEVPLEGDYARTYPFHKIIKQATVGDKQDIHAYLLSSTNLQRLVDENVSDGNKESRK